MFIDYNIKVKYSETFYKNKQTKMFLMPSKFKM